MLVYGYVGVSLYQHNEATTKLVNLDKLLALRYLTGSNPTFSRPATLRDLPHFYSDAMSESFNEIVEELDPDRKDQQRTPKAKSKFSDTPLDRSQRVRGVPMRMAASGNCDALVTRLAPGQTFNFITIMIVGEAHTVTSEAAQLASFNQCGPGPSGEFKALIFQLDDGQHAFAIPRTLEEEFLGRAEQRIFSNYPLRNANQIVLPLLPEAMRRYVRLSDEYVFLHAQAVDYLILNTANDALGRHFTPDRLDDAVQQAYEQKERDTSYFGINASSTVLVRLGPLVYFVFSFELWRRVRRLPHGKFNSGNYWFAFETRDILGRLYAFLYALAPLAIGVLIYSLFAISQRLGVVISGRVITVPSLITLDFPRAIAPGWLSYDPWALALLLLVPIHLLILMVTTQKLISVVVANARPQT